MTMDAATWVEIAAVGVAYFAGALREASMRTGVHVAAQMLLAGAMFVVLRL